MRFQLLSTYKQYNNLQRKLGVLIALKHSSCQKHGSQCRMPYTIPNSRCTAPRV